MIYVYALTENKCITHDGDVELGVFNFGVDKYLELCDVEAMEVHWKPDPHGCRYKRVNFQRHEKVAGKDALEGMKSESHLDKFRSDRVV